jgi:sucrose-6-phosphatase
LVRLAYVSGRDKELVRQAIAEFELPLPDLVIGDVGTTIYRLRQASWEKDSSLEKKIASDWNGYRHSDIVDLLASRGPNDLELQPEAKQGACKVSYFTDPGEDGRSLTEAVSEILAEKGIDTNLIWSVDEAENNGLLDILPASANKISAIRFVVQQDSIAEDQVLFAGDSGNDLDSLTSGLAAVLVANAHPDVRSEALDTMRTKGAEHRLYLARGDFHSLNGNYAAGVLEGAAHFFPEIKEWLVKASDPPH